MAKLIIPTPLRKFTDDKPEFRSPGGTVREVVDDLIKTYSTLKKHLIDDSGNIRSFVRIYVGDEDIKSLQNEETPIPTDGVVSIIPAIAGG
jgi:molybdopterin converting factor small subunit